MKINRLDYVKFILIVCLTSLMIFLSCNPSKRNGPRSQALGQFDNSKESHTSNFENRKRTVVRMKYNNGVYEVPIKVNGVEMYFIFDTGASDISISLIEAHFLIKQGKISEEDVLGQQEFVDATGFISVGTKINLRSVEIGNVRLQNVPATIVNTEYAPLLFGQSALKRFGKVTIDYENGLLFLN